MADSNPLGTDGTNLEGKITLQSSGEPYRILVVEDDLLVHNVIKFTLKSYVLDFASDPDTALKRLAETKYDLVYMDISLRAHMDGFQVAAEVRKHPEWPNFKTKIIAVTAFDSKQFNEQHKLIIDGYYQKNGNRVAFQNYIALMLQKD